MKLKIFQVDAFTDRLFCGNPAAICPLPFWLTDGQLQAIAAENNLSETAFYVRSGENFAIRWFTPETEVDLCGHATLASGYVVFHLEAFRGDTVRFDSRSGPLAVTRRGEELVLDFPADTIRRETPADGLLRAVGKTPLETYRGKTDYLLVYSRAEEVLEIAPDFGLLSQVPCRGVIVSAPGEDADFVSRFFAPQSGVPEDPVTGSAHTTLAPFWAERLGKPELIARQVSRRTGLLRCLVRGDRVDIAGRVVPYLSGEIEIPS
jgi:PhzF family phenazine biosynthesis protein